MQGTQKRTNEIKIRLEDELYLIMSRLADKDQRALADYIHKALSIHAYGHGIKVSRSVDQRD